MKKQKYQKRSVIDRWEYYSNRKNMTENQALFSLGYGDGAYAEFNKYLSHKKSYIYGYNRGKKARENALKVKF